jgi:hypothetical protein
MEEALRKSNISNGMCAWCTMVLEDNHQMFLDCPVWCFINRVWVSVQVKIECGYL